MTLKTLLQAVLQAVLASIILLSVLYSMKYVTETYIFPKKVVEDIQKDIHWKEADCSYCKGKGRVVEDCNELYARAEIQLYFASHARNCEICKKHVKSEESEGLPICEEASKKIESILEKAKKQPKDIQEGQCPYCGGTGKVWIEVR